MRRLLLLSFLLFAVACGGKAKTWQPANASKQIFFGAEDKVFIMPADLHVEGDPTGNAIALVGGFASFFGSNAVPGQPLKGALETLGVYNLSYLLAEGMAHGAFVHGDATNFDESWAEVPRLIGIFFEKINEITGTNIRYVATIHIDQRTLPWPWNWIGGSKLVYLETVGGIYDIQKKQAVSVVRMFSRLPKVSMAANMAVIANTVAKILVCPSQDKACRDAAPEKSAPAGVAMEIEGLSTWTNPAYR